MRGRQQGRHTRWVAHVACVGVLASLVVWTDPVVALEGAVSPPSYSSEADGDRVDDQTTISEGGIPEEDRADVLGDRSRDGFEDVAYSTIGGPDGVAVLRGRASSGFAWERVAQLPTPDVETDLWVSNSCMDPSSRYMAVVYAPRSFSNSEELFQRGAWGAVVDLETGATISMGRGYSMAYFNPGCGAGTFASFAHFGEGGTSRVASVDLEDGQVSFKVEIEGGVTSPVTMADGTVVAVSGGAIVHIDSGGIREEIATTSGRPFQLRIDSSERLAYLSVDTATHATARMIDLHAEARTDQVIAEGLLDQLGLARVGDSVFVLGSVEAPKVPPSRVKYFDGTEPHGSVSTGGALVVNAASPAGMGASTFNDGGRAQPRISAVAVETGREVTFLIDPALDASAESSLDDSVVVQPADEPLAAPAMLDVSPLASLAGSGTRSSSAADPLDEHRACAVPRNDPHNQAYQPKPRQVQWAVDRAVRGQLTEQRDANWRNLGMPAYSPQGLFPRVPLIGGGTIPPQIMLGILAQESNLWQASRYTSPGSTGNPLGRVSQ